MILFDTEYILYMMYVLWYHTFYQILLDTQKMRVNIFFANRSRITLNFTVHRNEYNRTAKIMCQQLTCKK